MGCPKKNFWTKQKTITPPFNLNGQSLKHCYYTHPSYGHFSLLPWYVSTHDTAFLTELCTYVVFGLDEWYMITMYCVIEGFTQ